MEIKEIHVGLSGVIPIASYENLRPSFDITAEVKPDESIEKCFARLKKTLHQQFDMEANQARIDLIEKQYKNIRFREKGGKKYPSVTSITDWDKDWKISDDDLLQYGARGNVVHALVGEYILTKKWVKPEDLPQLKEDLIILATGSLGLKWQDCSHQKFFEQFGKDFEFATMEKVVFNDEHLYSGRYDAKGKYKGKPSIIDFKTGSSYHHKQLAAYAVCERNGKSNIEQLVICPIGPTKNKVGYAKPSITENVKDNFKIFLKDRAKFHARFGV